MWALKAVVVGLLVHVCHCADNGLALTPPLGWLSWERFRCVTNCVDFPDDCISEGLIRNISDSIVSEGYLDAGYEYVIIDDCWLARERDENDRLQPDPDRFPSGMKALADYVHSKGLKFGVYNDLGTSTCAGYPGLLGHLKLDADTFAEWGVDYLKIDGCNADPSTFDETHPEFGRYLQETGRPIVYSCEWPLYQETNGITPNYTAIAATCNLWRNWYDIEDSYNSMRSIADHFADNQDIFVEHAGPGHWNDPDMIIIGNYGLSLDQAKAQMAIWSVLAAPLLITNDVRNTRPEFKDILQNRGALAINQDEMGKAGKRIYDKDSIEIWTRPITPTINEDSSFGIAIVSKRTDGAPHLLTIPLTEIGLNSATGYTFTDVFDNNEFEVLTGGSIKIKINPTGASLLRATPIEQDKAFK